MHPNDFRKALQLQSVRELAQAAADACGGREGFFKRCDASEGALRSAARAQAVACLEESTQLASGVLRKVGDLVKSETDVAPVARGLLKAIDQKCGEAIITAFTSTEELTTLVPGQIFPIARVDLKLMMPGRSFRSENLGDDDASLKHLGIAGRQTIRVRMDYRERVLTSGSGEMRVCAIVASPTDEEFEWLEGTFESKASFFGVTVKERDAYAKRLLSALKTAEQEQASIVILPELSAWPELTKRLQDWFRASNLHGMVAGSAHLPPKSKSGKNQATYLTGRDTLTHDKFNAFTLKNWQGKKLKPELVEALDRDPECGFTVHFANGVSFVFVVCKDAVDPEFLDRVREVRPTYLFIASMSPGLDEFSTALSDLGQTISFVTNFSQDAGAPIALSALPLRKDVERVKRGFRSSPQAPQIMLLSLKSQDLEWNRLDVASVS